ncbi:MAG: creatininase family protein [Planctomycetes bacterium]|nr:creatininase family protein [Planctomycetota bacterium]
MTAIDKLTWPEARARFGPDLVVLLPIGSTEPHGPHLPLDTDVTIAVAQTNAAAAELARARVATLVLPALPYGVTYYTDGFEGRVTLRTGTLWAVLDDIVESLEEQGVRRVVFSNAHLEPAHVQVLRGVAMDHAQRTKEKAQVLFPDNTRRRWAATLGEEFQSGDCHAGRYETSLVLAADSEHVREHAGLAPVTIDLLAKMKDGVRSFAQAGASAAYCGDPAAASAVEGRERIAALAAMIVASVRETWPELFQRLEPKR